MLAGAGDDGRSCVREGPRVVVDTLPGGVQGGVGNDGHGIAVYAVSRCLCRGSSEGGLSPAGCPGRSRPGSPSSAASRSLPPLPGHPAKHSVALTGLEDLQPHARRLVPQLRAASASAPDARPASCSPRYLRPRRITLLWSQPSEPPETQTVSNCARLKRWTKR
jgi:hypothetical protein